jgi:hypothetical protein
MLYLQLHANGKRRCFVDCLSVSVRYIAAFKSSYIARLPSEPQLYDAQHRNIGVKDADHVTSILCNRGNRSPYVILKSRATPTRTNL